MTDITNVPWGEYAKWLSGDESGTHYADRLAEATEKPAKDAERRKIIKANELPWENSPHGLLKHICNENMNTRAETVDAYMQIIPPGSRSGKHRQLAEQAFYVLEGRGYDIHVDCDLSIPDGEKYLWVPQDNEQRFEWEAGDVVYVPPNTISQHFNASGSKPARLVFITNRIYRQCGLDELEQLENAPEYDPNERLTAERLRRYLEVPVRT
jgi:quercetin dioxygenase-like cupin family protein